MGFFAIIKAKLINYSSNSLLGYFKERKLENYQDYLLFLQPMITENFYSASAFLKSPSTVDSSWYQTKVDFTIIAQTIDGDYIASDLENTYVIPISLQVADIESYPLSAIDFFIAYEENRINSVILAKLI